MYGGKRHFMFHMSYFLMVMKPPGRCTCQIIRSELQEVRKEMRFEESDGQYFFSQARSE